MVLGIVRTFPKSDPVLSKSMVYNTDIQNIFDAFTGLEQQTRTLGGLTITPAANGATTLNVTNAAGTSVVSVSTTDGTIATGSGNAMKWKLLSGTLAAAATTNVAHGLTASKIYGVIISFAQATGWYATGLFYGAGVGAGDELVVRYDATNVILDTGVNYQGRAYKILIFYVA